MQLLCYIGRREMASVQVFGEILSNDYGVSRGWGWAGNKVIGVLMVQKRPQPE